MKNKGFSLVELIVVIAIMAILVGVAVPVYSSYIEKANKSKDEQMVGEIVHALEIAATGDSWYKTVTPGSAVGAVVLTPTGASVTGNKTLIEKALIDTFGTDYATKLALSYDGWNIQYQSSSFYKNETDLLEKVDTLTGILKDVISENPTIVGEGFRKYLQGIGIDPDDPANQEKVADAAVLYVASQTSQMSDDSQQKFITYINNLPTSGRTDAKGIAEDLVVIFDGSAVTAAAALYATAEGYCRYEMSQGNNKPLEILDESTAKINQNGEITGTNQIQAVVEVFKAFQSVQAEVLNRDGTVKEGYHFYDYFDSQAEANSKAYLDVLSTINGAQNEVVGSLGTDDCFTSQTVTDLFGAYSEGGVIIIVEIDETGAAVIDNPLA